MTDCPICMETIETGKNCLTTECGHCFHTSCLMKSVAHNGFGCPYCRTAMTEEPEEEDDEEDDESTVYTDDSDEGDDLDEDDILRGFRMFFNRINGIENDAEDIEEEEDYMFDEVYENQDVVPPSAACIADELREKGISYEDLVNNVLYQVGLRGTDTAANRETSHNIWRIVRGVCFRPQQQEEQEQPAVDFEAQTKTIRTLIQLSHSQEDCIM